MVSAFLILEVNSQPETEMDYLVLKTLHIVGVCLFIGNNLVTPFWRLFAERTRNPQIIAYSQRLITLTDVVFTGGGILIILLSGHLMAAGRPELWQQTWFLAAYLLFAISGVIWGVFLLPIQIRQSRLAKSFSQSDVIPEEFWKLARRWSMFGTVASLLPIGSLLLMVLK